MISAFAVGISSLPALTTVFKNYPAKKKDPTVMNAAPAVAGRYSLYTGKYRQERVDGFSLHQGAVAGMDGVVVPGSNGSVVPIFPIYGC